MIAVVAFGFNLLVTVLVARRAFGPGRVSAHRVQGAVLVYLNVAALFAIAYSLIEAHAPGAIRSATSGMIVAAPGARTAELSYFSLSTITTVGYGDFLPVDPLARSLANLEAVFGQLFPATFLARLVALHLAHTGQVEPDIADARQPPAEDDVE
jgi:voltage-gated potassium channel Kch